MKIEITLTGKDESIMNAAFDIWNCNTVEKQNAIAKRELFSWAVKSLQEGARRAKDRCE